MREISLFFSRAVNNLGLVLQVMIPLARPALHPLRLFVLCPPRPGRHPRGAALKMRCRERPQSLRVGRSTLQVPSADCNSDGHVFMAVLDLFAGTQLQLSLGYNLSTPARRKFYHLSREIRQQGRRHPCRLSRHCLSPFCLTG